MPGIKRVWIRWEDIERDPPNANPPLRADPSLAETERIVNIETIKDNFGYARMRIWIAGDREV